MKQKQPKLLYYILAFPALSFIAIGFTVFWSIYIFLKGGIAWD